MKRALVTGATGYVGSNLVKGLIREGWAVGVIVRPSSSMKLILDVSDKIDVYEVTDAINCMRDIVGKAKPDVVFHIASLVINEHKPEETPTLIASNITFGTLLLEAMASHGVTRFVNTGTYWEHYQNKDYSPVNFYAATKRAFQDLLKFYVEAKGIRAITLKLFDPYGPKDPRMKLLNLLMQIADTGERLAMSPGDQEIDLVHIDDVVNAYLIAVQRLLDMKVIDHEIYGVGTGCPIKLKALATLVATTTGKKLNIEWGGRSYRDREVMSLWNGYERLPGWNPNIYLEEGLLDVVGKVIKIEV